jgi:hypothetical protein
MLSMKVTMSAIIKEFHFETSQKMEDIKLTIDRLLRSASGYPVKIKRRVKWKLNVEDYFFLFVQVKKGNILYIYLCQN